MDSLNNTTASSNGAPPQSRDGLKQLIALKERELQQINELRSQSLENDLAEARRERDDLAAKLAKTKEDFQYNLRLFEERDAELDRYDLLVAELRTAAEVGASELAAAREEAAAAAGRADAARTRCAELEATLSAQASEARAAAARSTAAREEERGRWAAELGAARREAEAKLLAAEARADGERRAAAEAAAAAASAAAREARKEAALAAASLAEARAAAEAAAASARTLAQRLDAAVGERDAALRRAEATEARRTEAAALRAAAVSARTAADASAAEAAASLTRELDSVRGERDAARAAAASAAGAHTQTDAQWAARLREQGETLRAGAAAEAREQASAYEVRLAAAALSLAGAEAEAAAQRRGAEESRRAAAEASERAAAAEACTTQLEAGLRRVQEQQAAAVEAAGPPPPSTPSPTVVEELHRRVAAQQGELSRAHGELDALRLQLQQAVAAEQPLQGQQSSASYWVPSWVHSAQLEVEVLRQRCGELEAQSAGFRAVISDMRAQMEEAAGGEGEGPGGDSQSGAAADPVVRSRYLHRAPALAVSPREHSLALQLRSAEVERGVLEGQLKGCRAHVALLAARTDSLLWSVMGGGIAGGGRGGGGESGGPPTLLLPLLQDSNAECVLLRGQVTSLGDACDSMRAALRSSAQAPPHHGGSPPRMTVQLSPPSGPEGWREGSPGLGAEAARQAPVSDTPSVPFAAERGAQQHFLSEQRRRQRPRVTWGSSSGGPGAASSDTTGYRRQGQGRYGRGSQQLGGGSPPRDAQLHSATHHGMAGRRDDDDDNIFYDSDSSSFGGDRGYQEQQRGVEGAHRHSRSQGAALPDAVSAQLQRQLASAQGAVQRLQSEREALMELSNELRAELQRGAGDARAAAASQQQLQQRPPPQQLQLLVSPVPTGAARRPGGSAGSDGPADSRVALLEAAVAGLSVQAAAAAAFWAAKHPPPPQHHQQQQAPAINGEPLPRRRGNDDGYRDEVVASSAAAVGRQQRPASLERGARPSGPRADRAVAQQRYGSRSRSREGLNSGEESRGNGVRREERVPPPQQQPSHSQPPRANPRPSDGGRSDSSGSVSLEGSGRYDDREYRSGAAASAPQHRPGPGREAGRIFPPQGGPDEFAGTRGRGAGTQSSGGGGGGGGGAPLRAMGFTAPAGPAAAPAPVISAAGQLYSSEQLTLAALARIRERNALGNASPSGAGELGGGGAGVSAGARSRVLPAPRASSATSRAADAPRARPASGGGAPVAPPAPPLAKAAAVPNYNALRLIAEAQAVAAASAAGATR